MTPASRDQMMAAAAAQAAMRVSRDEGVLLGFADMLAQKIAIINEMREALRVSGEEARAAKVREAEQAKRIAELEAKVAGLTSQNTATAETAGG